MAVDLSILFGFTHARRRNKLKKKGPCLLTLSESLEEAGVWKSEGSETGGGTARSAQTPH